MSVVITNDMTLEQKLAIIDDSLMIDPQEALMCDGCQ